MSIYISGPMTGLPDYNRSASHAAETAIRAALGSGGLPVINPAHVTLPNGTWADYMRHHIERIAAEVSTMVVLPGWECSRGARLEVDIAHALTIPVMPLETFLLHQAARR